MIVKNWFPAYEKWGWEEVLFISFSNIIFIITILQYYVIFNNNIRIFFYSKTNIFLLKKLLLNFTIYERFTVSDMKQRFPTTYDLLGWAMYRKISAINDRIIHMGQMSEKDSKWIENF